MNLSYRKGIQTRYFSCTPFLILFIEFCMVKISTSSCHFYPIRLMVCRDARLPSSIKKGNLLGIFEKWRNSKPSSRSTGNLKFSWPQSDLRDEKSSQPLNCPSLLPPYPNAEILRRQAKLLLIKQCLFMNY